MTDDLLRKLAAWIKPAVLQLTPEDLGTYHQAVLTLAAGELGADIVAAAHGSVSTVAREQIESAVVQFDTTFVGGDVDELVAHLAAAAVMVGLADESSQRSIRPALLIQSARFVGLDPKIAELPNSADKIVEAESRRTRERAAFKKIPAFKPLPPSATGEELVPVVNSTAKRLEDALAAAYLRIRQTDEEIDTLWWSRTTISSTAGKAWDELKGLERVITASLELSDLLSFFPPSRGAIALLRGVGGQPGGFAKLAQIGTALAATVVATYSERGPLFPLSTAAAISAEFVDKPKAVAPLLEAAGCDPKLAIPLNDLAFQLLREVSLAELL